MTNSDSVARHVELLHAYHLDLWTEMEGQLKALRGAQDQIAKLREAHVATQSPQEATEAARVLARHVQTLKGRIKALGTTADELDATVRELVTLLSAR